MGRRPDAHWKVDTAKQEIVSDGQSPHLATAKDYGDFEFYVDWLMVNHNGDSGIYPARVSAGAGLGPRQSARGQERRAERIGRALEQQRRQSRQVAAGQGGQSGRRVEHVPRKMVGPRVWVWLNDKPTVDGQVLDNLLRSLAAHRRPRTDRAPDPRIRDPLSQHLHPRDPGSRGEKTLSQSPK